MFELFETFCSVAETGSLSKAAEALHITQPAVTRKIKALEKELGGVLLSRTSHGVELTPVGMQVLIYARQALAAVAACRRAVAESTPGEHGRLAIASGNILMQFTLPPVLAEFREQHPDLPIILYTGLYQECLVRLTNYEVDLALIATPLIPPGLKARPLFTDPMMVVTPPDSPLAQADELSLADLEGQTLLVLPKQSGLRQQLTRVLAEANITCPLAEHSTVEMVKTMVGLGIGVTLLPQSAVAEEVEQGRFAAVPMRDWPDHGRTVLAVTRSEGAISEAVSAFLKALVHRYRSQLHH